MLSHGERQSWTNMNPCIPSLSVAYGVLVKYLFRMHSALKTKHSQRKRATSRAGTTESRSSTLRFRCTESLSYQKSRSVLKISYYNVLIKATPSVQATNTQHQADGSCAAIEPADCHSLTQPLSVGAGLQTGSHRDFRRYRSQWRR